ncbi:centromere/kinetochore protein zw10 homolog [Epargyreus clarus]|uniref:centromere/kinetochore protein zw10 homolog n=1 Tax=Epargyreus clarus TaxID=520877 RepID=UPI003C2F4513
MALAEFDIDNILGSIVDSKDSVWHPTEKIPLVIKAIEQIKADTRSYLQYINFDVQSMLKETGELYAESKSLLDEMRACKIEIEQETMADIIKSIENHDQIANELECNGFALDIVLDIIQYGRYLKEFNDAKDARSYTRSITAIYELLQFLESPAEGIGELDVYYNTQKTAQETFDALLVELNQEWKQMLAYEKSTGTRKSAVTISLPLEQSSIVVDVLEALDKSKRLEEKVSHFAKFILEEVLKKIIHDDCEVVLITDREININVTYKREFKPEFEVVMSNLRKFFSFISKRLNVKFSGDCNLLSMIGRIISNEFCEDLVDNCFKDTVPHNLNDLQNYDSVTSQIADFQHFLVKTNFFPDDNSFSILHYVNDMDVLFADRSSEHFLETARTIMLKDLSVTMSIGVEKIPEHDASDIDVSDIENATEALEVLEKTIPNSLFYFPRCMISKSAQELLDLVYVVMEQAVQCSDAVCKKLYCTVRLIFELYDAVVPYHHENFLQTIPQYVALFHNNCMYLAHNLLTLGDKWLNLMGVPEVDYAIGFVDLVQKMRELGYKHLTIHMQQQRKQILDNIRSSDLNCIDVKDVLSENAEAAVRQCLRQLQLLKNVWIGVFPGNVFTRLMATLVNMFIDELIHRVCTVEDISMEMATQLTDMYSLVVQKAPQLFLDPTDVETHVKSWIKLQELIFVLKGSLKDIEHHWNDGNGPLAVHFNTEELRSLVKALFQNTQFRANLLSKIK